MPFDDDARRFRSPHATPFLYGSLSASQGAPAVAHHGAVALRTLMNRLGENKEMISCQYR